MNTITFTATITIQDDCEDMTDEELLALAKCNLQHNAVVEVTSMSYDSKKEREMF